MLSKFGVIPYTQGALNLCDLKHNIEKNHPVCPALRTRYYLFNHFVHPDRFTCLWRSHCEHRARAFTPDSLYYQYLELRIRKGLFMKTVNVSFEIITNEYSLNQITNNLGIIPSASSVEKGSPIYKDRIADKTIWKIVSENEE